MKKPIPLLIILILFPITSSANVSILKETRVIQGNKFPKGSIIEYHSNGKIKISKLMGKTYINNFPCKGWTSFYETGSIHILDSLSEDSIVNGIKLKKGTIVIFYKSGKLKWLLLKENHTINGILYKVRKGEFDKNKNKIYGYMILFNENGKIIKNDNLIKLEIKNPIIMHKYDINTGKKIYENKRSFEKVDNKKHIEVDFSIFDN